MSAVRELPRFAEYDQRLFANVIEQLTVFCDAQSAAMGFKDVPKTTGDLIALINTELAEVFEAARKGTSDHPSEHIPEFTQKEEEWADVVIRSLNHSTDDGVRPDRLGAAVVAKLAFNRTRGFRHGGKRI